MSLEKPLVLDVDGSFLRTDMLLETLWAGLGSRPWATLAACLRHFRAPARLKAELARIAPLRTDLLPVNPAVAELALQSRQTGREVVLASAGDGSLVARLAADYGFSETCLASDGVTNLKGPAKAAALVAAYGRQGFDYVGNSAADMPVWEVAENAMVVGHVPSARSLTASGRNVVELPGGWSLRALVKAMRPHQWVKNVLLFLPMIAAHRLDMATFIPILWGFAAFSLAASAIYMCNDLLDLEADRLHATKCRRPFASGAVPISVGMAAVGVLGLLSLLIAVSLSPGFLAVTLLYMALSLAYSLKLKRLRWVDVTMLAALYTIRVVAGASAAMVEVSIYMLIFVFPIFFMLGCVKRITELSRATGDQRLPGRGYARADLPDLRNVAWIGIVGALVIFALYTVSAQGLMLYPTTWLLWVAMVPMAVWMVRMLVLAWHGRQDYDPIVFALTDPMGIGLLMLIISLMFWAAGLWQQWFG